jgi:hypothetical protein
VLPFYVNLVEVYISSQVEAEALLSLLYFALAFYSSVYVLSIARLTSHSILPRQNYPMLEHV